MYRIILMECLVKRLSKWWIFTKRRDKRYFNWHYAWNIPIIFTHKHSTKTWNRIILCWSQRQSILSQCYIKNRDIKAGINFGLVQLLQFTKNDYGPANKIGQFWYQSRLNHVPSRLSLNCIYWCVLNRSNEGALIDAQWYCCRTKICMHCF